MKIIFTALFLGLISFSSCNAQQHQKAKKEIYQWLNIDEYGKLVNHTQEYLSDWKNNKLWNIVYFSHGDLTCKQLHKGERVKIYAQIHYYDRVVYETQKKDYFLYLGQKTHPKDIIFFPGDLFHELPKGHLQLFLFIESESKTVILPEPIIINFKN